jgi:hypothetical protein
MNGTDRVYWKCSRRRVGEASMTGAQRRYSSGMRRRLDTSLEARERQLAAYRLTAPEMRLRLAAEMSADVRALTAAGIRGRASRTPGHEPSGDR